MQFFLDQINLLLIATACVSGGLLLWPLLRDSAAGGVGVTTLAATQMINSRHAQVVDVRPPDQFAAGSVPNARNIPLADIAQRCGELRKDRPVILVCNHGRTAQGAVARLKAGGIGEVYVLSGGVTAWRDAGLPLRK